MFSHWSHDVQCTRTLAQMNRTDSSGCLIALCLVPLEMETSTMNSEYCLSKSMRPYPLALPTVIPFSVLSVTAQSEQCGCRDRQFSCFCTEIVRRKRRSKKGGLAVFSWLHTYFFIRPFAPPFPSFLCGESGRHP